MRAQRAKADGIDGLSTFLIHKIGDEVRRRVADALSAEGIGPRHHRTLLFLDGYGPVSQREISEAVGLDPGDLVAILDHLDAAGLVVRRRDERDRRRNQVAITPTGRQAVRRGTRAVARVDRMMLASLPPEEQEQLYDLLHRVATALDVRMGAPTG